MATLAQPIVENGAEEYLQEAEEAGEDGEVRQSSVDAGTKATGGPQT